MRCKICLAGRARKFLNLEAFGILPGSAPRLYLTCAKSTQMLLATLHCFILAKSAPLLWFKRLLQIEVYWLRALTKSSFRFFMLSKKSKVQNVLQIEIPENIAVSSFRHELDGWGIVHWFFTEMNALWTVHIFFWCIFGKASLCPSDLLRGSYMKHTWSSLRATAIFIWCFRVRLSSPASR